MCGIAGIISARLAASDLEYKLRRMGDCQSHRGPDDERVEVYQNGVRRVGFGFVRLAILDLETGMQPVFSPVDRSALICNGQLYNYLELKAGLGGVEWLTRGDAEVALQMFRHHSPAVALQAFNGMYAGAFFSPRENKVILFRDRFGIKPLYYREFAGDFYFASEIKPLLAVTDRARLRQELFPTLFTYRYLPGEETIFSGIKRLPPGYLLTYDLEHGHYEISSYWQNLFPEKDSALSRADAEAELFELFQDAVRLRLRSDVEVGSFLSGGIDSCAVAAAAAGGGRGLSLFTIAFSEPQYNELPLVEEFLKAAAGRFAGSKHYVDFCYPDQLAELPALLRALEEPIFLGAVLPTDQVCRLAAQKVKTVLTGEGADEIFAGYRKFLLEMAAFEYSQLGVSGRRELVHLYPELPDYLAVRADDPLRRYIQSEALFSEAELARLLGYQNKSRKPRVAGLVSLGAAPRLDGHEHPLHAALAVETRCRLPDYVILRLDKLAMRHSLETRTPFLDYRLAEFAARLPPEYKIDLSGNRGKDICRRAFSRFGLLDEKSAWRRKQPFTSPLAVWLADRRLWPEVVREALAGEMIRRHGILNPAMVRELTEQVTSAGVGPATLVSGADRLFAVLVFTLWFEEFGRE